MKHIVLILILIISVSARASAQDKDDAYLDSLVSLYSQLDNNALVKLRICDKIAEGHYNVDSTFVWAERQLHLAKLQNNAYYEAKAWGYKGWAFSYRDDYASAIQCNFRAIIIADSIGNQKIKAKNYEMLGNNYSYLSNYKQSYIYYDIALQLFEELGDPEYIARCTSLMAQNCFYQKMYRQAEEMYYKAIALDSANNNTDDLLDDYDGLATLYIVQYKHTSSEKNTSLIAKARQAINKANTIKTDFLYSRYQLLGTKADLIFQEATIYDYQGEQLQSALDTMWQCINEGYAIIEKIQNGEKIQFDIQKANYYTLGKQYDKAKPLLDSLQARIDSSFVNTDCTENIYLAHDRYYTALNDYKNAYYYKSKFYEHVNSQASIDYAIMTTQEMAQAKFNDEMQQHREREQLRARIIQIASVALILGVLIAVFEVLRTRRHYRELNEKNETLQQQKSEIISQQEETLTQRDKLAKQNEEISSQNLQIKDSIGYASLIQRSVMPDDAMMQQIFSDYYVIYRPLNIVAGDFYWADSVGKYKMAVCADSTGHGVPGAFVSMLGISLLNDLAPSVIENNGSASLILNQMRRRLMSALGQSKEKYDRGEKVNMDGIDLALVIIDTETDTLHYAGAYRPLWIFSNGTLTEITHDKMPIGIYVGDFKDFNEKTVSIHKGDALYMFSDGITDQFGYIDDAHSKYKHFSIKRLFKLVDDLAPLPFPTQHAAINNAIDSWQNGYQQLDDITFLAIKL